MTSRHSAATTLLARLFAAAAVGLVLALTLWPVDAHGTRQTQNCIICGDRGVADALLNVVLFAPLGIAVALQGWRRRHALLAAAALSALVEVAQLIVPGRDAGLGDLLFNTVGGVTGVLAWRYVVRRTTRPRPRDGLAGPVAALVVAALLAGSAWAFGADAPAPRIASLWTPDFRHVEQYTGRVDSARIGAMPLPHETELEPAALRARLLAGDTLVLHGVAGRTPGYLSPVLAVVDFGGNEVLTVAFHGRDLVFRYRLRAAVVRLSSPGIRLDDGGGALAAGVPMTIVAQRRARDACLRVNAAARCGLGYDLAGSWRLLMDIPTLPSASRVLVGLAWLATLALAIGFLSSTWRLAAVSAIVVIAALALLPGPAGLLPTAPPAYAAVLLAGAAGTALARRLTARPAMHHAMRQGM